MAGLRGGMTFVNKHQVKTDDVTSLLYIDINNLYGWALSEKLPHGKFEWCDNYEEIISKCKNLNLGALDYGYQLEVDMVIPDHLHEFLNDLPVAPVKECPPGSKVKKLLLTHEPKNHYVIHWRLLQMYMSLGVKVTNVHRAIRFSQANIFAEYIMRNTLLRAAATSDFEKDYYKLMNNALFGKTVENLLKRMALRLVNTAKGLETYASLANFRKTIDIDSDLKAVLLRKEIVTLDRPSYIGQAVLDISKLRMYQLQYVELEKYRQQFKCEINIVAGDTDSFFLEVKNVAKDVLLTEMMKDALLDTSNYKPTHPMYSVAQKAVIGKFKDESKGTAYIEWIFLRPKCYSLLVSNDPTWKAKDATKMKAKGITLRNSGINHASYQHCYISGESISAPQRKFITRKHQLYTHEYNKVALSCNDDKRFWIGKNESLAYGHWGCNLDFDVSASN